MPRPSENRRTLTDAAIRGCAIPANGRYDILDAACPSLILRVSAAGRKTWIRRANGKRAILGTYPSVTLAEARQRCAEIGDMATAAVTVEKAAERFIQAHAVHLRSGGQLEWLLRKHVIPHIGGRAIASIGRAETATLLQTVQGADTRKRVRITNLTRGALSQLLGWAMSEGLAPSNPAAMVRPRRGQGPRGGRERVLSDDELRAVWLACEGMRPFGLIVRLLVLTGQRRNEVANIDWSELDVKALLWRIPAARMKAGRPHVVPLSEAAMAILVMHTALAGRAFPSAAGGPFTAWSKSKAKLDRLSGVTGWRIHDLRRTAASGMVRLGAPRDVVAMVLAHVAGGATGTYIRESDLMAMRAALDTWGEHVTKIAAPRLL